MGVRLTNCFASICDSPQPVNGFALIKLINPLGENHAVCNTVTEQYLTCGEVLQVEIDPITGCWLSCELPCNSDLSPAGTYYEIQEFVDNKCCGTHIVQLDCELVTYPDPTPIKDVSITNPGPPPASLLCPIVQDCETPFDAVAGCGITVTPGDHPDGAPGNGHAPIITLSLSADAGNLAECRADGLYSGAPVFGNPVGSDCFDLDIAGDGSNASPFIFSGDVIVDPDVDNGLICGPNGLFAKSTVLTVDDTSCIHMILAGTGTNTDPYIVTAEPVLSNLPDNQLVCDPSGLYVPAVTIDGGDCVTVDDADPLNPVIYLDIDSAKAGQLLECGPAGLSACVVVDGPCLVGSGTVADPIGIGVSPAPENLIECNQDGLHACIFADGPCLEGLGTQTDPIRLVIDPKAGNLLECGPEGLCVVDPGCSCIVDVLDSPTIDFDISGDGEPATPYVVTGTVLLSADPGNTIVYGTDGALFVPPVPVWDCTELDSCSIDDLGDVTITDPIPGDYLCWINGEWVNSPIDITDEWIINGSDCLDASYIPPAAPGDPHVLDLAVITDPTSGIECGPDGLRLTEVLVVTTDGTATGVDQSGSNDHEVDITLLSLQPGNILQTGIDGGLFVDCATVDDCAMLTITTDGDTVGVTPNPLDDHLVDITLLSGDAGNIAITGTDGGVYIDCGAVEDCVPPESQLVVTTDGTAVGVTHNPADDHIVDILLLSGDADNLLTTGSDGGLHVDCDALNECVISDLSNVNDAGVNIGDIFVWNGTNWVPQDLCTHLEGVSIECLGDVDWQPTPPAVGDYLCYDGTNWTNTPVSIEAIGSDCIDVTGDGTTADPLLVDVIVDPAAANILTCGPNGLFVSMADGSETDVAAGECVTVTGTGAGLDPYVVGVQVSAAAGNALVCNPDGLFISPAAFQCEDLNNCSIDDLADVICAGASDGDVLIWNDLVGAFVCGPTPAVAFDCANLNSCSITDLADVVCVAAGLGDVLTWNGTDWTCAPVPTADPLATANTTCIVLTGDGSSGSPLTATPVIDPSASNLLACGPAGLIVEHDVFVEGSDCIAVNGSGIDADPFVIEAIVDPDGAVVCGPDGLQVQVGGDITIVNNEIFVDVCASLGTCSISDLADVDCNNPLDGYVLVWSAAAQEFVCQAPSSNDHFHIGGDTDCIRVTVTGTGAPLDPFVTTASPVISPLAGNALTCTSDGLYAAGAPEIVVLTNGDSDGVVQTGAFGQNIDILLLSGDVDNSLSIGSDGALFFNCDDCIPDLVVTTDSTTLGVTLSGTADHVLDIVLLSLDADNDLATGADGGLFFNLCDNLTGLAATADSPNTNGAAGETLIGIDENGDCVRFNPQAPCERVSWSMAEYCDDPLCLPCEPVFATAIITDIAICAGSIADGDQAFDITVNGATVATATLPAGDTSLAVNGLSLALAAGDMLAAVPVSAVPAAPSACITVAVRLCDQ